MSDRHPGGRAPEDDKPIVETRPVPSVGRSVIRTYEEMEHAAAKIVKAKLAPRGMETPEAVFIAMETGMEAGLHPMAALRSVVVIGNIPSWKGDAALALIRSSGLLKPKTAIVLGTRGDTAADLEGFCKTWRKGDPEAVESVFTVNDAKRANLWDKQGPWKQYPKVMLVWRAVAMHSKRYWSDVLMGLAIAEEVQDYEIRDVTPRPEIPPKAGPDPLLASVAGGTDEAPAGAPPEKATTQERAGPEGETDPLPTPEESPPPETEPPHPGEEPAPPSPVICPGCQRHGSLVKTSGHHPDCAYKQVGDRLPTIDEITEVMTT